MTNLRPQWLLAADRMDRALRGYKRAMFDFRLSLDRRWRAYQRARSLFFAELGR